MVKKDNKEEVKSKLAGVKKVEIPGVNVDDVKTQLGVGSDEMPAEIEEELKPQVKSVIKVLINPDTKAVQRKVLIDRVGKSGLSKTTGSESMLNTKVKELIGGNSTGKELGNNILSLANVVEDLNPNAFDFKNAPGFISRALSKTFGRNPISNYLQKFIPANDMIIDIQEAIKIGAEKLDKNVTMLYVDQDNYNEEVNQIRKILWFARMLNDELDKVIPTVDDLYVRGFLEREAKLFLAQKLNALEQARFVKEQAMVNNELMIKTDYCAILAARNTTITIEAFRNAIIFNLHIIDAESVVNAIEKTNLVTSGTLVQTAQRQGDLIGKTFSKGVIAGLVFDKIQEAYNITLDNLHNYYQLIDNAIPQMENESKKLGEFSDKLNETRKELSQGHIAQKTLFEKMEDIDEKLF